TGGSPFIPNWTGNELEGVFSVKTIPDVEQINQYIEDNQVKKSLIVGGGYIALEMAESLKKIGIDVTLLIRSDEIGKMFDKDMQMHILEEAKKADVNVCFHEEVKQI